MKAVGVVTIQTPQGEQHFLGHRLASHHYDERERKTGSRGPLSSVKCFVEGMAKDQESLSIGTTAVPFHAFSPLIIAFLSWVCTFSYSSESFPEPPLVILLL